MNGEFLEAVQPVVLVGGRSRRFGRDKLREPWGDGVLVQRPIAALRAVFGARVKVVGECDASVAGHADGVLEDRYPGVGPIGGVLSALEAWNGPIFVLAGDMPAFGPDQVREVVSVAAATPQHGMILAWNDRPQPCAGVYTTASIPVLRDRLRSGRFGLTGIARDLAKPVSIDERFTVNINTAEDAASTAS